MKLANWNNAQPRSITDNETPFREISCPDGVMIRLYWTPKGAYGHQVMGVIYGMTDKDGELAVYWDKTGGCGYCKESHMTAQCFRWIGRKPRGFKADGGSSIDYSYRIGGNFYKVSRKDWMSAKGGRA